MGYDCSKLLRKVSGVRACVRACVRVIVFGACDVFGHGWVMTVASYPEKSLECLGAEP